VQAIEGSDYEIPPQLMAQMQQMQQALQQRDMQIKQLSNALENAAAQHEQAEAMTKDKHEELQVKWYEAETDRLKVMGTTLTPEGVQAIAAQTIQDVLTPQMTEAQFADGGEVEVEPPAPPPPDPTLLAVAAMMEQMHAQNQQLQQLTAVMAAPKQAVKDEQSGVWTMVPVLPAAEHLQ